MRETTSHLTRERCLLSIEGLKLMPLEVPQINFFHTDILIYYIVSKFATTEEPHYNHKMFVQKK